MQTQLIIKVYYLTKSDIMWADQMGSKYGYDMNTYLTSAPGADCETCSSQVDAYFLFRYIHLLQMK